MGYPRIPWDVVGGYCIPNFKGGPMKFNKPKKVKNKENAQRLQNYYDNKERILAQQKEKYHSNIVLSRERSMLIFSTRLVF